MNNWCVFWDNLYSPKTWHDAQNQCSQQQGHLVTVNDTNKQDFVARLMEELGVTTAWIGGRINVVDTWFWVSGKTTKVRYLNFA